MTLEATFLGLIVGVGSGFVVGMGLSRNRVVADILNPFIVAFNSMPRIAFVPLITMFFGLGIFADTALIHRVNTAGGNAPNVNGTFIGQVVEVPYIADYFFYRKTTE